MAGLKSSIKVGISNNQVDIEERKKHFGRNDPPQRKSTGICEMILECFEDLMLQVLVVASIVSTAIGIIEDGWKTGWMEGAAIMLAIVLIVSVTAGNNFVKER